MRRGLKWKTLNRKKRFLWLGINKELEGRTMQQKSDSDIDTDRYADESDNE